MLINTPGDVVQEDDVVAQIETDKVTIDVKFTGKSGKITSLAVAEGDTVVVGQKVAEFEEGDFGGGGAPAAAAAAAAAPQEAAAAPPTPPPTPPPKQQQQPAAATPPPPPPKPQAPAAPQVCMFSEISQHAGLPKTGCVLRVCMLGGHGTALTRPVVAAVTA